MPPSKLASSTDESEGSYSIASVRVGMSLRLLLEQLIQTLAPSAVRLIGAGFQFLSTVVVARSLGGESSAGFFFWSSILMTSGPIASYGLEQIALRNVPRLEAQGPDVVAHFVGNIRALSLALASLLGLGWALYATYTETNGGFHLWHLLPIAAQGAISITLINGEAFKGLSRPVFGSLYGHVLPTGIFCIFALMFAGKVESPGMIAAYTVSFVVGALLAKIAPGGDFRAHFISWPDKDTRQSLLREGLPVCCASLFGAFGFIIPLAICERMLPPAEISHLTAAFRIAILFVVLSGAIHGVFAPELSRSSQEPRPLRPVLRVYWKASGIALATLILPMMVGILYPTLTMSVFGEDFTQGALALELLLVLQLICLFLGPVAYLLLMTEHTVFLARLGMAKLVITVTLSTLLIPQYGSTGMVIAMGIAALIEAITGFSFAIVKMRARGIAADLADKLAAEERTEA